MKSLEDRTKSAEISCPNSVKLDKLELPCNRIAEKLIDGKSIGSLKETDKTPESMSNAYVLTEGLVRSCPK